MARLSLDAMLAEYATLRQESLTSITNRIAVMNFTFGALSVVIAGLLTAPISRLLSGSIALFFVPQMAKAGLLIWLGEYNRSQRAGRWIAALERKINRITREAGLLGWEGSLVSRQTHMSYPYVATILFILSVGYAGTVLGIFFLVFDFHRHFASVNALIPTGAFLLYAVALEGLFLRFVRRKWREVRTAEPPVFPVE